MAEETQERAKEERRRMAGEKDSAVRSEQLLLSMLANNADLYESVKDLITEEDFTDPLCNKLVRFIFDANESNGRTVPANIVSKFEEVSDQETAAGILNPELYEHIIDEDERKKAFADLVVRVLDNSIELRSQRALEADDAKRNAADFSGTTMVASVDALRGRIREIQETDREERSEKMENEMVATAEMLEAEMFDHHKAEAVFAVVDGKEVGFALYFYNFSRMRQKNY